MNKEVTSTEIMTTPLYEERDTEALGFYYVCHVDAMTAEDLNDKGDIAAELAYRDQKIQSLQGELDEAVEVIKFVQNNRWSSEIIHGRTQAFLSKHPTEVEGEGE